MIVHHRDFKVLEFIEGSCCLRDRDAVGSDRGSQRVRDLVADVIWSDRKQFTSADCGKDDKRLCYMVFVVQEPFDCDGRVNYDKSSSSSRQRSFSLSARWSNSSAVMSIGPISSRSWWIRAMTSRRRVSSAGVAGAALRISSMSKPSLRFDECRVLIRITVPLGIFIESSVTGL